ncbi:metallopeptidase TldD-related protein [Buchnera aphidicola (Chaitoregma tattakana)]|uniref:metallopeptidase TldD-related protein n=1 Tax=Buchnera aphidicola TaxID=9 RepID=UPI0031B83989
MIYNIFFEKSELKNFILKILNIYKKRVDYLKIYIIQDNSRNVLIRNSNLELSETKQNIKIHVDVIKNNKFVRTSFNSLNISMVKKIIDKAIYATRHVASDFCNNVYADMIFQNNIKMNLCNINIISLKDIINTTISIENIAFKFDNRIYNSDGINFYENFSNIIFGNSNFDISSYSTSYYFIMSSVIAQYKKKMYNGSYYSVSTKFSKLDNIKKIGEMSAKNAIYKISPKKIYTSMSSVIFSNEISYILFEYLSEAISGKNVYERSTFLKNSLGKRIFPKWLNILEDPHLKYGLCSHIFDSDGFSTFSKNIVKNGILKTWILNNYYANKLGLKSTGNSLGSYNWIIYSSLSKLFSLKHLLLNMYNGILVNELYGDGFNVVNGDYSIGVSGFLIRRGEILHPIDEITISGNLKDIFYKIVNMSNDFNRINKIKCGSILLSEVNISGK